MNRLTEYDEYGNADIIALSDIMPELHAGLSFSETVALTNALNKLAAYEDTGLDPHEVVDLQFELRLDKAAHKLMNFIPGDVVGATTKGAYTAFYHQERLYSVRNAQTGIVSLVYAGNPFEAIDKVKGGDTNN